MLRNIFWGAIFLSCAIFLIWSMVPYIEGPFKASSTKKWPTTMGVVVSSKAVRSCSKSYSAEILYQYKVKNISYVGNRLTLGFVDCGSQSDAQAIANQYPVNLAVMVHFNPELPSEAVILAGQVSNGTWWGIFTIPFMIIVSIFLSWSFLRNVRIASDD